MAEQEQSHGCESCALRGKYDSNPKSILGRIWRWHIIWCPGWKKYFQSLDLEKQQFLADKYGLQT
jgi:hypothetical protein